MPIHNYKTGNIDFCQICNSKQIEEVMNFGYQPLADDLIPLKKKSKATIFYPLIINFCKKCILLQTGYIVGDNTLYTKDYHYLPGISKPVLDNFNKLAKKLVSLYSLSSTSKIIDIGCNDGSLLNEFKKINVKKVLGIEPTNTYRHANKKGIKTINDFLNNKSSKLALQKFGKADVITTTNVFAHSNKMKDFILGVKSLLNKNGTFVIENHYLLDVIKFNQFDTFYHEHLRTYSLKSLITLLNFYGFYIKDAYISDRYGGNIQAHFSLKKNKLNNRVKKILSNELKYNLNKKKTYLNFFKKIFKARKMLDNFLEKNTDKFIVGKAFPARASVLIHFFTNLKNHLKFIAEQPISKKINYFAPGTNIRIISSNIFKKKKPDIMIILAWHMYDQIKQKWLKRGLTKVKFVKPLPYLKIDK